AWPSPCGACLKRKTEQKDIQALDVFFSGGEHIHWIAQERMIPMKKLWLCLLALLTAITTALPALSVQAAGPEITAPSAVLMEASTGRVLFQKEPHQQRPCASITKVMTLCLVFE